MKILPAVISLFLVGFVSAQPLDKSAFIPIRSQVDLLNGGESRIIGGEAAKQGEIPYQAQLYMKSYWSDSFCGGSLITPRHILTAAHCVQEASTIEIKLGGVRLKEVVEPGTVVVNTKESVYHEDYSDYGLHNDIAIITLKEEVELSDTIQTIRLPKRSDLNDPLVNVKVNVSGHGLISDDSFDLNPTLQHVELTTISNEACGNVYGASTIISTMICAVGNPHHSTCNGDSGGPLYRLEEDGVRTQVGIVSFGSPLGCEKGYPSGFTRTVHYLDFIHEHTGLPIRD